LEYLSLHIFYHIIQVLGYLSLHIFYYIIKVLGYLSLQKRKDINTRILEYLNNIIILEEKKSGYFKK